MEALLAVQLLEVSLTKPSTAAAAAGAGGGGGEAAAGPPLFDPPLGEWQHDKQLHAACGRVCAQARGQLPQERLKQGLQGHMTCLHAPFHCQCGRMN